MKIVDINTGKKIITKLWTSHCHYNYMVRLAPDLKCIILFISIVDIYTMKKITPNCGQAIFATNSTLVRLASDYVYDSYK